MMWLASNMYMYSVHKLWLSPTSNTLSGPHAITYFCSIQLCSWTPWQRTFWTCFSTITGISIGSISAIHSKHWSSLFKATGGRPCKLSPTDTQYAICLITSQKADNTTNATKTLQYMTNTSFTVKTVCRALCGVAMRAVTKQKPLFLSW